MKLMTVMWNQMLNAAQSVDKEVIKEAVKIIVNHYIPNAKQVQLLSELQRLVHS